MTTAQRKTMSLVPKEDNILITKNLKKILLKLVNIPDAFIVYVFIHSLEPAPDNNQSSNSHSNLVLFEAKKKTARLSRIKNTIEKNGSLMP